MNFRLNRNTGEWDWDALANHFDTTQLSEWGFTDNQLTGFATIDYSILDDADVDLEAFKDGTRKAIQIEFKMEDYEEANTLVNARSQILDTLKKINWVDGFFRKDIGWRALENNENNKR